MFMMHPFSGLESDAERRKRIAILNEDATDKDYEEKLINSYHFFSTTMEQALIMLKSLVLLTSLISIEDGRDTSWGWV